MSVFEEAALDACADRLYMFLVDAEILASTPILDCVLLETRQVTAEVILNAVETRQTIREIAPMLNVGDDPIVGASFNGTGEATREALSDALRSLFGEVR